MQAVAQKLVIIGGVAGGATSAARARRLNEQADVLLIERGPDVSFANCGYIIRRRDGHHDCILTLEPAGRLTTLL